MKQSFQGAKKYGSVDKILSSSRRINETQWETKYAAFVVSRLKFNAEGQCHCHTQSKEIFVSD